MNNRTKNSIYSALLLISILLVWNYRKNRNSEIPESQLITGQTMGTSYHITYFDAQNRNFKKSVDSLLNVVNQSINTYDTASEVSRFNKSKRGIPINLPYLYPPLEKAREVHSKTNGAFDPTVMPLVNMWGFGPGKKFNPDTPQVDSIKNIVGLDKISIQKDSITKTDPRIQLDFGGIGQGYGGDVVTQFLTSKGITNMLVEVGGEGMAVGKNLKTDNPWRIGILDPASTYDNQFFIAYVSLTNQSFTTSGNYFNYQEEDGVKYSHTIDPFSGYPAKRAILSASVFSKDCTTADAWGTALMVMGHEKGIEVLKQNPEIDVFLIYSTEDGNIATYTSEGIRPFISIETKKP